MKTRKNIQAGYEYSITTGNISRLPGKILILVILLTLVCPHTIFAQGRNEAVYPVFQPSKPHKFFSLISDNVIFSEPELLNLVKDADPGARQFAILQLAEIMPPSEAAVAAVCQGLADPDENVRF